MYVLQTITFFKEGVSNKTGQENMRLSLLPWVKTGLKRIGFNDTVAAGVVVGPPE